LFSIEPNDKALYNCSEQAGIITQSHLAGMPKNAPVGIGRNSFISTPVVYDITRLFDIIISSAGLIIFLPFFLLIALIIKFSSRGPVIFSQKRVGKNNRDFTLYKFRTMCVDKDDPGSLMVSNRNNRITAIGHFLRRYKLDELPQLYNVLKNEMSMVGPRPELRKYVNLYSNFDREVLYIKPGITDHASILFRNEAELLALQQDPEQHYIETVVPVKIRLNKKYANNKTLKNYFIIIIKTIISVLK
jgi:lipopolysaccharide/colanic/teichoic acid biosynthesis glycosyltransferase